MMEFYLAHIGVNPKSNQETEQMMELFTLLFPDDRGLETPLSWFRANGKIEVMKDKGYGEKGHMAFYASDIHEAMKMLEEKGYRFDEESAKYDSDGSLRLIYLDREINGFAIHLTTRK